MVYPVRNNSPWATAVAFGNGFLTGFIKKLKDREKKKEGDKRMCIRLSKNLLGGKPVGS